MQEEQNKEDLILIQTPDNQHSPNSFLNIKQHLQNQLLINQQNHLDHSPQQRLISNQKGFQNQVSCNPVIPQIKQKNRLIIHKIILQDFKSYAGKQTIGPLHHSFTSIVGANGSGKSNLLESLLFIFGFNANWVRLSRLSQLIHKSSGELTKNKASVQVQFHKLKTKDSQEYIEEILSIKRVVTSQSASKYYINNRQITHTKLRQRLRHEGIDLTNNRFLILQGQVESIAQMKCKGTKQKPGMLQYLEQIIGSDKFLQQIEDLAAKYSELEQLKHTRGQSIKILQNKLRSMIGPKQQSLKYTKLQTRSLALKTILLQLLANSLQNKAIHNLQNLQNLQAQKIQTINLQKQKLQKQKQRISQIKINKKKIEAAQKQEQQNRKTLQKLNIADKNLNKQVEFKSQDAVKYEKKAEEYQKQLSQVIKSSEDMIRQLPGLQDKLKQTKQSYQQLKQQVAKYNRPQLSQQIRKYQKLLKNNQIQTNATQQKIKTMQKQFEKLYADIRVNDQRMKSHHIKIQENQKILVNIKAAIVKAQFVQKDLSRSLDHFRKKQKTHQQQISKIQTQIQTIKEQNQQTGTINNMFTKIMQAKIPGVLGRLGDLGRIRPNIGNIQKYDEILSSCINKKLDHIVVKDIQAGQAVIQFLKQKQLGRVSCIILDKIQQFTNYMHQSYQTPHRCLRLYDLIQPKIQQARVAFYFILRDTLYCEDSNQGLRYAMDDDKNRRRVISSNYRKNGFIIYELNGLMNGCPKKSGGFQTKVKLLDFERMSGQVEQLMANKLSEQKQLQVLQSRITGIKKNLDETDGDIIQLKKQRSMLESMIESSKDQLDDLKKSNYSHLKDSQSEQKKHKKQQQIVFLKQKLIQLDNYHKDITQKLFNKQQQQKSLQSQQIQQLRKKYNSVKQQYEQQLNTINNNKAVLSTTSKKIDNIKKQKSSLSNKITILNNQIKKMKRQRENMQKMAISILSNISECENKLMKFRELDKEMRILLQEQNKQVLESKRKIQEIKNKVDEVKKQIKKLQSQKNKNQKAIIDIRNNYTAMLQQYSFLKDLKEIQNLKIQALQSKKHNNHKQHKYTQQQLLLEDIIDEANPLKDLSQSQINKYTPLIQFIQQNQDNLSKQFAKCPPTDIRILGEYMDKCKQYQSKMIDMRNTQNNQNTVRLMITKKKQQRLDIFIKGFNVINSKLKEVYQYLTKGGDAQLQQIDTLDPFSDGISFSVRPYKKSWKQINKLSGGEKTLSSLSLILALHHYKPNPIYFMDQIDAALDFKNVQIVANYLKQRTQHAQFIVISLRNNMFQVAERLIGIYKISDCTNIIQWEAQDDIIQTTADCNIIENDDSQNNQDNQDEESSFILPMNSANDNTFRLDKQQDVFRQQPILSNNNLQPLSISNSEER